MDISSIPKAELHCHIDGLVDPVILQQLEQDEVTLPLSSAELLKAYPVCEYDDFIHWFDVTKPIDGQLEIFKRILALHIDRLKAQNVTYTEIMLGSSELPRDSERLVETFRAFREYVYDLEGGKIQVEFLVAVGRAAPLEWVEKVAKAVVQLRNADLLYGIAVAGWPEVPIRPLKQTLAYLNDSGVGIEIHAGEWGGPESVWDALENGYPDRIGHGVSLFQDPKLIERFQKDQIHIEFCPTSNLKTGSVKKLKIIQFNLHENLE